jgi:hypothetical protein
MHYRFSARQVLLGCLHSYNSSPQDVVIPSNALLCNLQPAACLRTPATHASECTRPCISTLVQFGQDKRRVIPDIMPKLWGYGHLKTCTIKNRWYLQMHDKRDSLVSVRVTDTGGAPTVWACQRSKNNEQILGTFLTSTYSFTIFCERVN